MKFTDFNVKRSWFNDPNRIEVEKHLTYLEGVAQKERDSDFQDWTEQDVMTHSATYMAVMRTLRFLKERLVVKKDNEKGFETNRLKVVSQLIAVLPKVDNVGDTINHIVLILLLRLGVDDG